MSPEKTIALISAFWFVIFLLVFIPKFLGVILVIALALGIFVFLTATLFEMFSGQKLLNWLNGLNS